MSFPLLVYMLSIIIRGESFKSWVEPLSTQEESVSFELHCREVQVSLDKNI